MTPKLEQLRDGISLADLNYPGGIQRAFKAGFNAGFNVCHAELWPVIEELSLALNEIHRKLTPKIPRMDGKESWTISQRFIDDTVTQALSKAREKVGTC